MIVNEGVIDRVTRVIVGVTLILFALGYIWPASGWNWVGWFGLVPIVTGVIGNCPMYTILGLSTYHAR